MEIKQLPKDLFDQAVELGIDVIELSFSGGSDEGYLDISLFKEVSSQMQEVPCGKKENDYLDQLLAWAEEAYDYDGTGDGIPYGDDIEYHLKNKNISHKEWYHVVKEDVSVMSFDQAGVEDE